jgi:predicted RNA-binding Zn-ribbon protein involved in translation (DUF1610 family)
MKITEQIFNTLNNMLEECADMAAEDTCDAEIIACPVCGETDTRNLEVSDDGIVLGCGICGYEIFYKCPNCGETDMDKISPPGDDGELFYCQTCGVPYEI